MLHLLQLLAVFLLVSLTICANTTTTDKEDNSVQLITVVVVFRHGDRVIITPYPNDPYKNNSYWPAGWGQLTNEGKRQQLELGQWLRQRYKNFLPETYSEKDIYVRSTNVDRTLMSAEVNLAGLYPPRGRQVWDTDLLWQPIPIHTEPEKEDAIVSMKRPCPEYDLLLNKLMESREIKEINERNRELYEYVAENAGIKISNFDDLEYLYNNLFIETLYNFTLPDWTGRVFPDKLKGLAEFSFAVPCYTPKLSRLKAGPFFHELLDHLFNVTSSIKQKRRNRKMWLYSGHDTTIADVLQSLEIFQRHCPPYASTILFELRRLNRDDYFVNVLYKNSSEPQEMTLKGCDFNCPLERFAELLEPIDVSLADWEIECKLSLLEFSTDSRIMLGAASLVFGIAVLLTILTKIIYSRCKRSKTIYLRLPDDDEQA